MANQFELVVASIVAGWGKVNEKTSIKKKVKLHQKSFVSAGFKLEKALEMLEIRSNHPL
jgi:predicted rRNA methylase YqxC with S4 and FtsJ domains